MRIGILEHIPGARPWLAGVTSAAIEAGHDVLVVTHRPEGPHDFLERSSSAGDLLCGLFLWRPDVVVCADYPYGVVRGATQAPVVGIRHSLAARGNTFAMEQSDADWLATWSAWDEAELGRRGVVPRRGFLRCGPAFVGRRIGGEWDPDGSVLWCPTWNPAYRCEDAVLPELVGLVRSGIRVRARPHPATSWREPDVVEAWGAAGLDVEVSGTLLDAVASCSVLVSDVSGAGLTGLLLAGGGPPVVHIDPAQSALLGSAQYDPEGPEWAFRAGSRSPAGIGLARLVEEALDDRDGVSRVAARAELLGDDPEPDPCARLIALIGDAL